MSQSARNNVPFDRLAMALVGAASGIALWLFVKILPDLIENTRILLFLTAFVMGYFAILMALTGPARMKVAAVAALALALPAATLLVWASLRFENTKAYLDSGLTLVTFILGLGVTTPFIAAALQEKSGWKHYRLLFDISWVIVVRYAASWLFVAVFWGVLMLSDALFEIVGITFIEDLLDIAWVPYLITGTVLGLALAVVHELSDYVSPFLILRLLRLLLPVVLLVVAVFIVALPFRGLDGLFGSFSAAATLMAMAWAGITLVTTALDKSDDDAVANAPMLLMTRGLAALLPIMAVLSTYAIWLRVKQYGLTPDRIAAGFLALFIVGYSLAYLVAILRNRSWMADIRKANRLMAMALVAVCALWFTPLFNMERLSTNSQITRFEAGEVSVDALALWEMAHDWGFAGTDGLARLRMMEARDDHAALVARIDLAVTTTSKYVFMRDQVASSTGETIASLRSLIVVKPDGATLPEDVFQTLPNFQISQLQSACERLLSDGRPGCVAVIGTFNPAIDQPQGIFIFLTSKTRAATLSFGGLSGGTSVGGAAWDLATGRGAILTPDAVKDALDGKYTFEAANLQALTIGGVTLIPDN